jgi:lipoprotein-anchoring transpeptidase ErfK/SrfK
MKKMIIAFVIVLFATASGTLNPYAPEYVFRSQLTFHPLSDTYFSTTSSNTSSLQQGSSKPTASNSAVTSDISSDVSSVSSAVASSAISSSKAVSSDSGSKATASVSSSKATASVSSSKATASDSSSKPKDTVPAVTITTLRAIKIDYSSDDLLDNNAKVKFVIRNKIPSATHYLIWVSLSQYTVNYFHQENGKWLLTKVATCAVGAPDSPTIEGMYQIRIRKTPINSYGVRVFWGVQISGGYYFHSICYNPQGSEIVDDRLGKAISHGCIRQTFDDAKYLYNTIPAKTTVYINH